MPNLRFHLPDQQNRGTDHLSRRDFVKRACVVSLGVPTISAILAACGDRSTTSSGISLAVAQSSTTTKNATSITAAIRQSTTPMSQSGYCWRILRKRYTARANGENQYCLADGNTDYGAVA